MGIRLEEPKPEIVIKKHPYNLEFFINDKLITIKDSLISIRQLTGVKKSDMIYISKFWEVIDRETYIDFLLLKLF